MKYDDLVKSGEEIMSATQTRCDVYIARAIHQTNAKMQIIYYLKSVIKLSCNENRMMMSKV